MSKGWPEVPDGLASAMKQWAKIESKLAENQKRLRPVFNSMAKSQLVLQENMAQALKGLAAPGLALAQQMKAAVSPLVEMSMVYHRQMQEAWESARKVMLGFEDTYRELLRNASESVRKFAELADRFAVVMLDLDWPPTGDFTASHMAAIVQLYDKVGLEIAKPKVDHFMLSFYNSERLDKMVAGWESKTWFQRRLPILKAAVQAHKDGLYELSVPTLSPQIEGILVDGYGFRGYMTDAKWKARLNGLFDDPNFIQKAAKEFILLRVLVGFQHGNALGSTLSRHAILHGGDVNYATAANSLKAILLFDFLQRSFNLAALPKSKVYHLVGCYKVIQTKQERVLYAHEADAKGAGLKPCRLCHPDK